MKVIRARLKFFEPIMGTAPLEEEIYKDYIASKADPPLEKEKLDDETDTLPDEDDQPLRGKTVFHRLEDDSPFIYDYQIKGFFKDACAMLSRIIVKDEKGKKKKPLNESGKLTAYKKVIDGLIFVFPRKIKIEMPDGVELRESCRPLRASTPKGERVALSYSEEISAGAYIDIEIKCLSDDLENAVREWLDYGELRGLGQWRNSGMGRFTWEELK